MRKIGVEEELMLVDPETFQVTGVSAKALRAREEAVDRGEASATEAPVDQELFLQQIETATKPVERVSELLPEIVRGRCAVGEAARSAGAAAVAVPTPVLSSPEPVVTRKDRYLRLADEYGEMSRQSFLCGMHVHVDIHSEEEGVRALDGIRPWLPTLLAISANSPFFEGRDTRHASWRSQTWNRWPTSGPAEPFGDVESYRATLARMIEWGAAADDGMIYLDARLSATYPTLEIRVADVCTEVEDAALVATLGRALVETAAQGTDGPEWRSDLLRAAGYRASRFGVTDQLVNPLTREVAPARQVFEALRSFVEPALREAGDWEWTEDTFERLLSRGSGAARQRSAFEASGSVEGVVKDLIERTEMSWAQAAGAA